MERPLRSVEFSKLIRKMPIRELLQVQFFIDGWRPMIEQDPKSAAYLCNICTTIQGTTKNLFEHINGKNHTAKISNVVAFYQPRYTYSKSNVKSAEKANNVITQTAPKTITNNRNLPFIEHPTRPNLKLINTNNSTPEISVRNTDSEKSKRIALVAQDGRNRERALGKETESTSENVSSLKRKAEDQGDRPPKVVKNRMSYYGNKTHDTLGKTNKTQSGTKVFSIYPGDGEVHGLIGVEYVIKRLKNKEDPSPRYECILCELVLSGFEMQNHLVGYNHRLKFCEKHFPAAVLKYRQHMNNLPESEIFKVMIPALHKLALAIEKHFGRRLPYEFFEHEYRAHRWDIYANIFSSFHASEVSGQSFTHVISSRDVDELIAQKDALKPPPVWHNITFDSRPYSLGSSSNIIWQTYLHLVDQKKNELDERYKTYNKNPRMHPLYDREWQKFWKRRKEELIQENLFDYRTYNFVPEWVQFFTARMGKLYQKDIENIKIQSWESLFLPVSHAGLSDPIYHNRKEALEQSVNSEPRVEIKLSTHKQYHNQQEISEESLGGIYTMDKQNSAELPSKDKPGIISVLRLVMALEDCLGSLKPKIVDLLTKALQVEKTKGEEVNLILLTAENCALLRTAAKKFKGFVDAKLLDGAKMRLLKTAIQEVRALVDAADEMSNTLNHIASITGCRTTQGNSSFDFERQHQQQQRMIKSNVSISASMSLSHTMNEKDGSPETHYTAPHMENSMINFSISQTRKNYFPANLIAVPSVRGTTNVGIERLQYPPSNNMGMQQGLAGNILYNGNNASSAWYSFPSVNQSYYSNIDSHSFNPAYSFYPATDHQNAIRDNQPAGAAYTAGFEANFQMNSAMNANWQFYNYNNIANNNVRGDLQMYSAMNANWQFYNYNNANNNVQLPNNNIPMAVQNCRWRANPEHAQGQRTIIYTRFGRGPVEMRHTPYPSRGGGKRRFSRNPNRGPGGNKNYKQK